MKKQNKNFTDNFIKIFMCFWFVFFLVTSIAYCEPTRSVRAESQATIQQHIYDYVYISSVVLTGYEESSALNRGTLVNKSFKDHEMIIDYRTPSCGNYIEFAVEIVNTSSYYAFITQAELTSLKSNYLQIDTASATVKFPGITVNETYIEPHSTKTFVMQIESSCNFTLVREAVATINMEFSLYQYYQYVLNCTPSDSTVTLTTSKGTYTGNSGLNLLVLEGDTVSWKVEKNGYNTQTGSITMPQYNYSTNVVLEETKERNLTVTSNVSNAVVSIKQNGVTLATGVGSVTATVAAENSVTYEVSQREYYYTQNGDGTYNDAVITETMPLANTTRTVTLYEKAWINLTDGSSSSTEVKTGSTLNYHPGYYLVELWGGIGGRDYQKKSTGGAAGNVYGLVYLNYGDTLYYYLGGNGTNGKSSGHSARGAFGGVKGHNVYLGGSAGCSVVLLNTNSYDISAVNAGTLLMVAAGGGSSAAGNLPTRKPNFGDGGAGGNMSSTHTTTSAGHVYYGSDGGYYVNSDFIGHGATTSGGEPGTGGSYGVYLEGGESNTDAASDMGGSGGAGYYGGGGGAGPGETKKGAGGGGGGSSFISTVLGRTQAGSTGGLSLTSNSSSTGGGIRIRFVSR